MLKYYCENVGEYLTGKEIFAGSNKIFGFLMIVQALVYLLLCVLPVGIQISALQIRFGCLFGFVFIYLYSIVYKSLITYIIMILVNIFVTVLFYRSRGDLYIRGNLTENTYIRSIDGWIGRYTKNFIHHMISKNIMKGIFTTDTNNMIHGILLNVIFMIVISIVMIFRYSLFYCSIFFFIYLLNIYVFFIKSVIYDINDKYQNLVFSAQYFVVCIMLLVPMLVNDTIVGDTWRSCSKFIVELFVLKEDTPVSFNA